MITRLFHVRFHFRFLLTQKFVPPGLHYIFRDAWSTCRNMFLKQEYLLNLFKGARSRYFRQFQHWSNCHRINLNIKITAPQNYRRTWTKLRKDKKGRGWTKLERTEVDCIWINLKNVGPHFFKFTVCQFKHYHTFITTAGKSFSVVMCHDFANERLLVCQFDVLSSQLAKLNKIT